MLAVVGARVLDRQGRVEVHVRKPFEADAAFANIPRVLRLVELEIHDYIVYTIKLLDRDGGDAIAALYEIDRLADDGELL